MKVKQHSVLRCCICRKSFRVPYAPDGLPDPRAASEAPRCPSCDASMAEWEKDSSEEGCNK